MIEEYDEEGVAKDLLKEDTEIFDNLDVSDILMDAEEISKNLAAYFQSHNKLVHSLFKIFMQKFIEQKSIDMSTEELMTIATRMAERSCEVSDILFTAMIRNNQKQDYTSLLTHFLHIKKSVYEAMVDSKVTDLSGVSVFGHNQAGQAEEIHLHSGGENCVCSDCAEKREVEIDDDFGVNDEE